MFTLKYFENQKCVFKNLKSIIHHFLSTFISEKIFFWFTSPLISAKINLVKVSDHEEADIEMFVYCQYVMMEFDLSQIVILSPDTDVAVYAATSMQQICHFLNSLQFMSTLKEETFAEETFANFAN